MKNVKAMDVAILDEEVEFHNESLNDIIKIVSADHFKADKKLQELSGICLEKQCENKELK